MNCVKIGIVGCGNISRIYLENISNLFREIEVAGIYDTVIERAEDAAGEFGVPRVYKSLQELLDDGEVDIVLNLTRPTDHFAVTQAAVRAKKHVYSEKPLGITLDEGKALVEEANANGVMLGGAPDTFLGAALQTCRKLIDDGFIGVPVGVSAFFSNRGAERWHPNPEFFYQHGGGPILDMGPYYITALVHLLGGIQTVSGFSRKSFDYRTITSKPNAGQKIKVEVDTYSASVVQFESGVIGTLLFSFDIHASESPRIEIYGSEGTLSVPDPNCFGGDVRIYRPESGAFTGMPLLFDYPGNCRGLGVADLAKAIRTGRKPRAGSDLILHVLEVMSAICDNPNGVPTAITSKAQRPEAMTKSNVIGIL